MNDDAIHSVLAVAGALWTAVLLLAGYLMKIVFNRVAANERAAHRAIELNAEARDSLQKHKTFAAETYARQERLDRIEDKIDEIRNLLAKKQDRRSTR